MEESGKREIARLADKATFKKRAALTEDALAASREDGRECLDSLLEDGTLVVQPDGTVLTAEVDLERRSGVHVVLDYLDEKLAMEQVRQAVAEGMTSVRCMPRGSSTLFLSREPVPDS